MLFLVTILELSAGLYATVLTTQEAIIATRETAAAGANNRGLSDAGDNPIAPGEVFTGRDSEEGRTGREPPSTHRRLNQSKGSCEKYQ